MNAVPRLSVGLPVYNGANYLAESLDALLGQTFEDFELIISDNASTDDTADICQQYAKQDSRITYFRQPCNIGLAPNHNFTVDKARADLFKWASNDDLYARDLLKLCVEALDEHPQVVLAHSWTAMIDGLGTVTKATEYPLTTSSPHAPERFRSTLFDDGGDDDGGVIRTELLRRIARKDSYHHADRTIISEIALHGPFYQVPTGCTSGAIIPTGPSGPAPPCLAVREHGSAAGGPVAESRCPALRRIHLGICGRHQVRAAITSRQARVLPLPVPVADQSHRTQAGPAGHAAVSRWAARDPRRHGGRRPGQEAVMTVRDSARGRERSAADRGRGPRIGLFGLLGSGNIGNDASMESVLGFLGPTIQMPSWMPCAWARIRCGPGTASSAIPLLWYQKYDSG